MPGARPGMTNSEERGIRPITNRLFVKCARGVSLLAHHFRVNAGLSSRSYGVRGFFPQHKSRSRSGLLPLESAWRYCLLIRAWWGKCRAPHHVTAVLSLGRRMSGVFVSMRRTLLSCSSLARNGLIGLAGTLPLASPAWAGDAAFRDTLSTLLDFNRQEVAVLTTALALLGFSVLAAILLMHTRIRAAKSESRLHAVIEGLQLQADRYRALLFAEPQILISWAAGDNRPRISGDTS